MPTKNKDNLIHFPKIHSNPPINEESVAEKIRDYKESYSSELAEIIWENVLGEMARAGCDFDEDFETYFPGMILIFEAIRSLHLQTMGTEHQLQPFALQNVVIMDSDEERVQGGLKKTLNEETIDIDEDL
jgi:hypothetical protein|tara:strand:+ start:2380 stop:2769 length:390 start_codon:yes stop_codon:yes gene_type:complete